MRRFRAQPGKAREIRDAEVQRRYGVSLAERDAMFEAQQGLCGICRQPMDRNGRRMNIDHDHVTGRVRGLLCSGCNRGIGYLGDSVATLQAAIAWLS